MHPLDKLKVHDGALLFIRDVYVAARSISELDLRGQLLRSARSIAANLAEGAGSESQAAFARYIAIAIASARESQSHLQIARASGQLSSTQYEALVSQLALLMRRMYRLLIVVRANTQRRAR